MHQMDLPVEIWQEIAVQCPSMASLVSISGVHKHIDWRYVAARKIQRKWREATKNRIRDIRMGVQLKVYWRRSLDRFDVGCVVGLNPVTVFVRGGRAVRKRFIFVDPRTHVVRGFI